MSVRLDPLVSQKLRQFRQRRLVLMLVRGISAGVVTLLVGMSLVAAIDWYWLLSDETRWYLSGAAYAATVFAAWMTCVSRLWHIPAQSEIAAQMELTEPQLRENLLSAVELATDDPAAIHDSPVFRSLLQGKVAQQMLHIQVPRLLPIRLVGAWLVAAVIVVGGVAFLLNCGDVRFRQLAARAFLPGANIARISRIQVKVLAPTPQSLTLAEDETVAVVVDVTGGNVSEVILETTSASQGTVRHSMRGATDTEYASNIHVADESIDYRILAGDAVTQRFRIETRARPHVLAFHKSYAYPDYTRLPAETVTEAHGDLIVIQGTQTELVLEIDQEVSRAELRLDPADSDEIQVIPLTATTVDGKVQWAARVPAETAAIYKVHLVSSETGFENVFSPKYEIRPQPDLIPRAGFVDQQDATLLLPPNDILALKGMAEDDLPLEQLEQQISINGREWLSIPLKADPADDSSGRRIAANWQWDLLTHKLKTGDQVLTKLVATDRKGNLGESIPLRIIVAAPEFDPKRHAVMERKLGLHDALARFADLLEEHKTTAMPLIERLQQPEVAEEQSAIDRIALADLAARQREQAALLLTEVKEVERDMPAGADAYDLELTGRVVTRLERDHTNTAAFLITAMEHADDAGRKRDLDELKRTFERTADDSKRVAEHYQYLMAHNFLSAIAIDLDALWQQQQQIVDSPTQTWERLLRQETLVVNQLRVLERVIGDQRQRLPKGHQDQIRQLNEWAQQQRQQLQDAMESEDKLPQLQQASQNLARQLADRQRMDAMDGGLPDRLVNSRRDLHQRAGSLYVPIDQLARATQQENRSAAEATESADSTASKKLIDVIERFVAEVDLRHRRSLEQLPERRELTQARVDADAQYAADTGLTHRAVTWLLSQHRQVAPQDSPIPDQLLEVAPAYRVLEAGHELQHAQSALRNLLTLERWNSRALAAHIDHPRQFDVMSRGLEMASERLREAGVPQHLVDRLNEVRWSEPMRQAGRKITERRWKRDVMPGAGHELVGLRENLDVIMVELEPIMAEARAKIAKYAPTIPQMAEQIAQQLRELEKETTATADVAEQPESQTHPPKLAELQLQQEAINRQLEELFEALVEDANAQDVLDEGERERARDADDSIAMIQDPARQMNDALKQAEQQETGARQAQDLAQAAEQQERTAQALDLVSQHFEKLDDGQNVAESRAELRQSEQELGLARQMDQRYDHAEQLASQAIQESPQLMADLEAELERNPAMQQALSEIARNTLQEAREALEYAANETQEVQRNNERSDVGFQARKQALTEDLQQLAQEAGMLSRELVAQASQAADRGKTPEAQQKLAEAQQQLNTAAERASQARQEQLLEDLAASAQETRAALQEAVESLKQAEALTSVGQETKIHADDKARDGQQRDNERSRQQFQDQQKRTARDVVKRAEEARRRAEQEVKREEEQLRNADRKVEQAQQQLNRKPDEQGLKDALAREQASQRAEQQQVQLAKESQQRSEQRVQQAQEAAQQVEQRPTPPLNAPNPATQLADQYAEQAIQIAERIKQRSEAVAAQTNFGQELTPSRGELAASEQRQGEVTEDVSLAAEEIARAARHERRLNNAAVADPLQQMATQVQQVSQNESTTAEQRLSDAARQAQQAEENQQRPAPNNQALDAQAAAAQAERAISQQAEELNAALEPLLAAAETEAQAVEGASPSDPAANSSPASGTTSPTGTPPPSGNSPPQNGGEPGTPQSFTPEQLAQGQQLARTLDELDRQQAAAAQQSGLPPESPGAPGERPTSTPPLDTLAQAAQLQRAAMAAARTQARQQAAQSLSQSTQSADGAPPPGPSAEFAVQPVNRADLAEWGKLRNQSAEDLTNGRKETVSEEYRKSVEAYFRVLAERAKKK